MSRSVAVRRLFDVGVVAFCLVAGAHSLWVEPLTSPGEAPVWWFVDLVAVLLAALLVLARRRVPVAVALAVWSLNIVSPLVWGASCVVTFGLAARRPWRVVAPLVVLSLVMGAPPMLLREQTAPSWLDIGWLAIVIIALVASGTAVRVRRELLDSLVDRAERAENEAALRAEAARTGERTRIAREMHDVLAHRLSLVSMHAGALAHRTNPSRDEVADALEVIRSGASRALVDLRAILGVLRDPATGEVGAGTAASAPQPTLDDLDLLLREVRAAGTPVALHHDLDLADVPDDSGRALYRIAQESLTNAARHAPGAPVDVRLTGRPGADLALEVSNPLVAAATTDGHGSHGAGTGLLGVAERVALAGGEVLARGPDGGRFRVAVTIPWSRGSST